MQYEIKKKRLSKYQTTALTESLLITFMVTAQKNEMGTAHSNPERQTHLFYFKGKL